MESHYVIIQTDTSDGQVDLFKQWRMDIDKGHLIGKLYCKLFLLTQSKFVFHLAKTQILRGDDFKSHIVLEKYAFL